MDGNRVNQELTWLRSVSLGGLRRCRESLSRPVEITFGAWNIRRSRCHQPDVDIHQVIRRSLELFWRRTFTNALCSQMLNHVHHVRDSLKRRIFIGEQIQNTLRTGAINLSQTLWELTVAYWL